MSMTSRGTSSAAEGLSVVERRETGFFALINGTETEHQLCLLATL